MSLRNQNLDFPGLGYRRVKIFMSVCVYVFPLGVQTSCWRKNPNLL